MAGRENGQKVNSRGQRGQGHGVIATQLRVKQRRVGLINCYTADSDQMWSKYHPSSEDFITQRTLTKCGQKNFAPHGRTCHTADSDQMWSKYCPSSEDFVTQRTLTRCGREFFAPCGGLCHAADSNQMWSIMFIVEWIIHHSQFSANKTSIQ